MRTFSVRFATSFLHYWILRNQKTWNPNSRNRIGRRDLPFSFSRLLAACMVCSLLPSGTWLAHVHGADPLPLKDLDGHFPFSPPASLEEWKLRSEEVREQILVSQGISPMPTLAAMKPRVHSTRAMDGYSISKVYFESLPGFFVTGSLYQPLDGKPEGTKRPAVLCPHGHWDNGRFYQASDKEIRTQIATGAERFINAARNPMQARSVQLARMGCVVFLYDMIGYADSQQISFDRAHRYGMKGPNPERTDGKWLLYSPQAEGYLQSTMGLQTINSLQAFEFLAARSDVDPTKIAITGASGGGTQTFIAAAIEPRIAAAMPAVMVSTSMQGGCTCENACLLRVGTGNVELAATIAPRPMGLTAANDWTKDVAKDGFPELQKIYGLFDATKKVELHSAVHHPHNYNHVARVSLYGFINRTFGLGMEEPILEKDFEVQTAEQLTVWDQQHPAPESGIDFEADLLTRWQNDRSEKIKANPQLSESGWRVLLAPAQKLAKTLQVEIQPGASGFQIHAVNSLGTSIAKGRISKAKPRSIRLGGSGESDTRDFIELNDPSGLMVEENMQAVVKNPRPAAAYTFGYNPTAMIRRVGNGMAVLDALQSKGLLQEPISIQARGDDVILAKILKKARPTLVHEVIAEEPTDEKAILSHRHPAFVPGLLLYGID